MRITDKLITLHCRYYRVYILIVYIEYFKETRQSVKESQRVILKEVKKRLFTQVCRAVGRRKRKRKKLIYNPLTRVSRFFSDRDIDTLHWWTKEKSTDCKGETLDCHLNLYTDCIMCERRYIYWTNAWAKVSDSVVDD